MIIKILLIASAVALTVWMLRGQRRAGRLALTRLLGLLFAAGWVVAVLFPGAVSEVAQAVGVGRGTDLVLYVLVVTFIFTTLLQQRRVRELEGRLARLTRAQALMESRLETPDPVRRGG